MQINFNGQTIHFVNQNVGPIDITSEVEIGPAIYTIQPPREDIYIDTTEVTTLSTETTMLSTISGIEMPT
jgi:hypothetical protein